MRVALDATALGSGRGGDETSLRGLLAGLVSVVPDDGSTRFVLYMRPGEYPARPVLESPVFVRRDMPRVPAVARYLIALPLLTAFDPEPSTLLYSVTHTPLLAAVPMVLHLHDLSFVHQPELYTRRTRWRLSLLAPIHAHRARAIFVPSEFSRQSVIDLFGIPASRVFVVPNAIESGSPVAPLGVEQQRMWLERWGIHSSFFVYVGNLHPRKNLRRLIEAFGRVRRETAELAEYQLVIIGAEHRFYPRVFSDGVAVALRDLPPDAVVFVGRVSDDDRDRLIATAVALAYPSLYEGFGLPPLEAMNLGTPVVASATSSMPEVLGDAALLVDPRDVNAIASALARLALDVGLRAELRVRGKARASQFSPRRTGASAYAAFCRAAEAA